MGRRKRRTQGTPPAAVPRSSLGSHSVAFALTTQSSSDISDTTWTDPPVRHELETLRGHGGFRRHSVAFGTSPRSVAGSRPKVSLRDEDMTRTNPGPSPQCRVVSSATSPASQRRRRAKAALIGSAGCGIGHRRLHRPPGEEQDLNANPAIDAGGGSPRLPQFVSALICGVTAAPASTQADESRTPISHHEKEWGVMIVEFVARLRR
jgi:hypothetical protein